MPKVRRSAGQPVSGQRAAGQATSERGGVLSRQQIRLTAFLVVGNLVLCIATSTCLWILHSAELDASRGVPQRVQKPRGGTSALGEDGIGEPGFYDDDDGPAASTVAPGLRVQDSSQSLRSPPEPAQPAAGTEQSFYEDSAASRASMASPAHDFYDEGVASMASFAHDFYDEGVAPKLRVQAVASPQSSGQRVAEPLEFKDWELGCWPCGGPIKGPLPTTFRAAAVEAACRWETHKDSFVFQYAADVQNMYTLDVAKKFCLDLGSECSAVICSSDKQCSARSGAERKPSTMGETTYMKICTGSSHAAVEDAGVDGGGSGSRCTGDNALPAEPPPEQRTATKPFGKAAVVILAHNRKKELVACISSLLAQPDVGLFEVIVSLDDRETYWAMKQAAEGVARELGAQVTVWPLVEPVHTDPKKHNSELLKWLKNFNTAKIAHHYWVALERSFYEQEFEKVIFVEEDLLFSPDFLALFRSTAWLLDADPSLWCVSAWNDFGFKQNVGDPCRLMRTSYFPGLGFMLTRPVWLELRQQWPVAPTMGWDYWMRVAFRRQGKECIIPEVPRSHHDSKKGASVTKDKQLRLLGLMATATIPSICGPTGQCHQFGDISYLREGVYESWISTVVDTSPRVAASALASQFLDPNQIYILPFDREGYSQMAKKVGIYPAGLARVMPADLRAEHYGVAEARHQRTRARILVVDKRSPRFYLKDQGTRFSELCQPIPARKGLNCVDTCVAKGMRCDKNQMYFFNNCSFMERYFGCEAGCAHQVGPELPVYVSGKEQPTYQQCLVTLISPMSCTTKHDSTERLCGCMPD